MEIELVKFFVQPPSGNPITGEGYSQHHHVRFAIPSTRRNPITGEGID